MSDKQQTGGAQLPKGLISSLVTDGASWLISMKLSVIIGAFDLGHFTCSPSGALNQWLIREILHVWSILWSFYFILKKTDRKEGEKEGDNMQKTYQDLNGP